MYSILRSRILNGTYGPGHRLVIDVLARELEVSQMPIREAIRRLEAEEWVVYNRHQGALVSPVDERLWIEATTTLAVLEGFATALAAPHLTPADHEALQTLNDEMGTALGDLDVAAFSEHNMAFHATLHARCPNAYLRRQVQAAQDRVTAARINIFIYIPTRGSASIAEHETIARMVAEGSPAPEIERVAREHKLHTVVAFERRSASGPDPGAGPTRQDT